MAKQGSEHRPFLVEGSRRTLLKWSALGLGLIGSTPASCAAPADSVSVADYRRPGDRDDSESFRRALRTGRPLHVPAGQGSSQDGSYRVSMVRLPSGATIHGDGERSVIAAADSAAYAIFYADAGSPKGRVDGIALLDLLFESDVARSGFREHSHLLAFFGVSNLDLSRLILRGFRGDGIILEGANPLAVNPVLEPRHNDRIVIADCLFDGVNNDNRNGLSIIDGTDVRVSRCLFRRTTRPNMPGAIDIEPNPYPFYIVRGITIEDCRFERIGGNIGVMAIVVPAEVRQMPAAFIFRRNMVLDYLGTGADYSFDFNRNWSLETPKTAIAIEGHQGVNGQRPFAMFCANGVSVDEDCRWTNYKSAALIGYSDARDLAIDLSISGTYTRIGQAGPPNQFGMAVFNARQLRLGGIWIDCGDGSPQSAAILFLQGSSSHVHLDRLSISSPSGKTKTAISVAANHRLDPASNRISGVSFGVLPSQFRGRQL